MFGINELVKSINDLRFQISNLIVSVECLRLQLNNERLELDNDRRRKVVSQEVEKAKKKVGRPRKCKVVEENNA